MRLADALGGALGWGPGAAVSRRASVGAGALLLTICAVGIGASRDVSAEVALAEHAATTADLYQDARYYAVLEDAELNTYQLQRASAVRSGTTTRRRAVPATCRRSNARPGHAADLVTAGSLAARHGAT
ncbi:MAG: hypothetical protein ABJC62_00570, partial [Frankiaceae bacterium]